MVKNAEHLKIKNIHFIINPAAGKFEPILPVLNEVFKDSGIKWDVSITKKTGDGSRLVKELIESKIDVIGVYGGDGTIAEIAGALIGSDVPLAILPGGTGNVMATDLDIPKNLREACLLITQGPSQLRAVDLGYFNRKHFILRIGLGFEADMVKGAQRETKNRFGRVAYFLSAVSAMQKLKLTQYNMVVDGKEISTKGSTCIIANSGSVGFADFTLDKKIDMSDGLLDVLVVKQMYLNLFKFFIRIIIKKRTPREVVGHWQGQDIKVIAKPTQIVQCDGEPLEKIPVHVKVLPQAIQVIVPQPTQEKATP